MVNSPYLPILRIASWEIELCRANLEYRSQGFWQNVPTKPIPSEMNPIPAPGPFHESIHSGAAWVSLAPAMISSLFWTPTVPRNGAHGKAPACPGEWRNQHLAIPRLRDLRVSGSQGFHGFSLITNWVTNEWTDPGRLNSWTPGRNEDPFPQGTIVLDSFGSTQDGWIKTPGLKDVKSKRLLMICFILIPYDLQYMFGSPLTPFLRWILQILDGPLRCSI